jgi:hypothetical protein
MEVRNPWQLRERLQVRKVKPTVNGDMPRDTLGGLMMWATAAIAFEWSVHLRICMAATSRVFFTAA